MDMYLGEIWMGREYFAIDSLGLCQAPGLMQPGGLAKPCVKRGVGFGHGFPLREW